VGAPIGIAGAGRVAQAIGRLLVAKGEPVAAVASRTSAHAAEAAAFIGGVSAVPLPALPERAGRILIAVSDDAIEEVARALAVAGMGAGAVALHTCGARGPEILAPLAAASVSCGVLHPLQTIASAEQGVRALAGCAYGISGDADAAAWAQRICGLAGGTPLYVAPERMGAYHAAAVMASNYVTGLLDAAVILMKTADIDGETALGALGPLVRASVDNALAFGPGEALTGPIVRGDLETVRRHVANLAGPPAAAGLYRSAGLYVLEMARRRGLAEAKAAEIEALLRQGR
jgi:predicted short-subunit dehydrogenase-like oxidoreductase (DUF2520 family)